MRNVLMQEIVALEADRITKAFFFEKLVELRSGKRRIAPEEPFKGLIPRYRLTTGSNNDRQSSALCTFPGRNMARSTSPSWLKQKSGW